MLSPVQLTERVALVLWASYVCVWGKKGIRLELQQLQNFPGIGDIGEQILNYVVHSKLHNFPGNGDIGEQVQNYMTFGSCLLKDKNGVKVGIVVDKNQGNVGRTNDDIFNQFLIGSGKLPVTWRSFVECLEQAGLNMLVEGIFKQMTPRERDSYSSSITRSSDSGNRVTGDDEEEGYPVEDKLHLFSDLREIGKWESLCALLGVKDGIMNDLRESTQSVTLKKQDCLTSYYKSGDADWQKVVVVVANYPFENTKLTCDIAKKRMNWSRKDCRKFLDQRKDEL